MDFMVFNLPRLYPDAISILPLRAIPKTVKPQVAKGVC